MLGIALFGASMPLAYMMNARWKQYRTLRDEFDRMKVHGHLVDVAQVGMIPDGTFVLVNGMVVAHDDVPLVAQPIARYCNLMRKDGWKCKQQYSSAYVLAVAHLNVVSVISMGGNGAPRIHSSSTKDFHVLPLFMLSDRIRPQQRLMVDTQGLRASGAIQGAPTETVVAWRSLPDKWFSWKKDLIMEISSRVVCQGDLVCVFGRISKDTRNLEAIMMFADQKTPQEVTQMIRADVDAYKYSALLWGIAGSAAMGAAMWHITQH